MLIQYKRKDDGVRLFVAVSSSRNVVPWSMFLSQKKQKIERDHQNYNPEFCIFAFSHRERYDCFPKGQYCPCCPSLANFERDAHYYLFYLQWSPIRSLKTYLFFAYNQTINLYHRDRYPNWIEMILIFVKKWWWQTENLPIQGII